MLIYYLYLSDLTGLSYIFFLVDQCNREWLVVVCTAIRSPRRHSSILSHLLYGIILLGEYYVLGIFKIGVYNSVLVGVMRSMLAAFPEEGCPELSSPVLVLGVSRCKNDGVRD